MMKNINNITIAFKLAVLLLAGYLLVTGLNHFVSLRNQQLKNDAVNGCMQVSGHTETSSADSSNKYFYPLKDIYTVCMRDKGYTTSW